MKGWKQAVHGCRQFVFWYVWLSPRTNATLQFILLGIYKLIGSYIKLTVCEKQKEDEEYVKSLCP